MQIIMFYGKEYFFISQKEGYTGEKWKEKDLPYIYIKTNKQTSQMLTINHHLGSSDIPFMGLFLSAVVSLITQNGWSSILLTAVLLKEGK